MLNSLVQKELITLNCNVFAFYFEI